MALFMDIAEAANEISDSENADVYNEKIQVIVIKMNFRKIKQ